MTLFIVVLKHQWHAYCLFQCVIIYLYSFISSIYIYHYIFILIIIYLYLWFIIQSVVGVIGIVGNILTILVLSTKVRNRQWGELFEKLEMMRIILCLKYWQCGGLFCVLYKSFFSKIEFKFSAECTHLGPLKKFCNPFAIFLIFSDERQTTKRWSINFLLIGSLLLFFSNVVICSSCQGRSVNVGWRPDNSILLIFFLPIRFHLLFFNILYPVARSILEMGTYILSMRIQFSCKQGT